MVSYITESSGGDFQINPEGQHTMVCFRVIDIGSQKGEYQEKPTLKRKIAISWELPNERTDDGRPMVQTERFNWTMSEKSNLRPMLGGWRGRKFRKDDFAGPPNGFDIRNLLGVPCIGQIMHDTNASGKTYANIKQIMAFPTPQIEVDGVKKMDRSGWPKPENPLVFFDLDNFDQTVFDALPEYWQNLIKLSPEYEAIKNPRGSQTHDSYDDIGFDEPPPF